MAKATADKACRMDIRLTQPQRKNYEKAAGLRGQFALVQCQND